MFNDAKLNEIVERVQTGNLTIAQARNRLASANAFAHSAASGFKPNADLSGLANASTGKIKTDDMTRRPAQLNLEMGWEIALFGQDKLAQQSADMGAAMAVEDVEAAKLSVIAEATTSYMRLRALQQQRKDAETLTAMQTKNSSLAETRARYGLGTDLEAQAISGNAAAAAQEKLLLDSAIADELQRIAILQGRSSVDPALSAIKSQPRAVGISAYEVPAGLLRRRADVRRAEYAVLQAGAEVDIAQSDLYPKLRLSGMIGFGSPVSGSLFGLMGGPSLQLPLFDHGKRLDVVTAKRAQLDEALAAFKQTVLLAYGEASASLRALQTARQDTTRIQSAYATAMKAKAAAELLSREGLSDASKTVERQIAVVELHRQLTEAVKTEAEALIVFAKATGGTIATGKVARVAFAQPRRKN